jgi:hypothetical protein
MPGSMIEFPDSFEPIDLSVVPDVPRSGAAHGDPGIRSSPPGLGGARPCAVARYGLTSRGAAPGHLTQTYRRGQTAPFEALEIA